MFAKDSFADVIAAYTDSNGASNASVPTNTKNHQFPFREIDGFLLVGKNPKPTWITISL